MMFWSPPPEWWTDPGPIAGSQFYKFRAWSRKMWGKYYGYFPLRQEWVDQWAMYLRHQEMLAEERQMYLDQLAEYYQIQEMYKYRGAEIADQLPYELHTMGLSYRRRVQDRKDERPYEKVDYCSVVEWFYDDYAFYYWIGTWHPLRPYGVTIDRFFPGQDDSPIAQTLAGALGAPVTIEFNAATHERPGLWIVIEHRSGRGGIPHKLSYQQCLQAMPKSAQPLAWPAGMGKNKAFYLADLGEIYNLGIGGSVGGGKSNEINAILCTWISRNSPDDLRLFLVDFKRVELAFYKGLPHLGGDKQFVRKISVDAEGEEKKSHIKIVNDDYELKDGEKLFDPMGKNIVTEGHQLIPLLDYLLAEIERRTKLLEGRVKKISTWNKRFPHKKLSRWVLLVDELGDIMLQPKFKEKVEERLVRIGQLGRAMGVHLVLATQTPKSSVITGLIQNNLTNWIAFRCGNGVASGLMLDGKYDAARLPAVPGRCIWREGGGMTEMQTPEITDLTVRSIVKAAKEGEVSHVISNEMAIDADRIFEYALKELDGYCPIKELYQFFKKINVPRVDIETILKEYEVSGYKGALEPEIEINDNIYYLAPPPGGQKPRQLIPGKEFEQDFDKKWAEILASRIPFPAKNGKTVASDDFENSKTPQPDTDDQVLEEIDERTIENG